MSDYKFNKDGVPLLGFGKSHMMITKGAPVVKPAVTKQSELIDDKLTVGGVELVAWGASNDFPTTARDLIKKIGCLNTGLRFLRNLTMGQGIFPCTVEGYDEQGNEILKVIDDKETIKFCQSRMVRRYLEKALRDYLKYGVANVQMLPDEEGTKLVGLNTVNSIFNRYGVAKDGVIGEAIYSGKFPDAPGDKEYEKYIVLDEYDPAGDLNSLKLKKTLKGKQILYPIRDSWSNAEYYSEPIWYSAYLAGWTDIALSVPTFLQKAYLNQITWKWHIQIPYAFWDKKFPREDYADISARQAAIESYMDALEENLTSPENADKSIFTFFEVNPQGKAEEQWIITALDNKYKEGDKLITSAAANSEILFSLMINPNVMGAGMPGGAYAGNQGGSNIREAFLVNIANSWIDRQTILDPLELFLEFNGKTDVQLRFRQTILTTLDTGAGTKKTLS